MPILEIEIVLRPGESLAAGLASRIADAARFPFFDTMVAGPQGLSSSLRSTSNS